MASPAGGRSDRSTPARNAPRVLFAAVSWRERPPKDAGPDVQVADGKAVVKVEKAGMYRLINNRELDTYDLTLTTTSDGLAMYAFTFTSCLVPDA